MKLLLASLAIALLATSAEASDIKVYDKGTKAQDGKVGLQAHGIELSRAQHKRGKSKRWGRVNGPDMEQGDVAQPLDRHTKKKSPAPRHKTNRSKVLTQSK